MSDERTIDDRVAVAITLAQRSRSGPNRADETISIHVGQDVWDWMREKMEMVRSGRHVDPVLTTAWGFPVLLEAAWPSDKIAIRTEQVIY